MVRRCPSSSHQKYVDCCPYQRRANGMSAVGDGVHCAETQCARSCRRRCGRQVTTIVAAESRSTTARSMPDSASVPALKVCSANWYGRVASPKVSANIRARPRDTRRRKVSARDVDPAHRCRLDLVVYGATPLGEALCCDVTLVSPLTREGRP